MFLNFALSCRWGKKFIAWKLTVSSGEPSNVLSYNSPHNNRYCFCIKSVFFFFNLFFLKLQSETEYLVEVTNVYHFFVKPRPNVGNEIASESVTRFVVVDVSLILTKTRSVTVRSKHCTKWMDFKSETTLKYLVLLQPLESIHLNTQVWKKAPFGTLS